MFFLVIASAMTFCLGSAANKKTEMKPSQQNYQPHSGKLSYEDQVLPSLQASGMVCLNKSTVKGATEVQGHLKATQTGFNSSMNVQGRLDLNTCTVEGAVEVQGHLKAIQTGLNSSVNIQGRLDLNTCRVEGVVKVQGFTKAQDSQILRDSNFTSNRVIFQQTQTKNITIHPDKDSVAQTLQISNGTIIDGNVTFISGNGVIENDGTAKINGRVYGLRN